MSGKVTEYFKNFLTLIKGAQHTPNFYYRIPDDQVLPKGFTSQAFVKDRSYFQIRLSEMFLRDRRDYWRGFVPLTIVLSDFIYNRERQSLPFLVGNQLLKGIEKYLEGEYVEYYNTRIVGPVPFSGDDVGLFVGLLRTQVTDLAANLLNFLETLIGAFDLSQLSPYLGIAKQMRGGITNLLRMKEVEFRLGDRDVFTDGHLAPEDPQAFRDGYLIFINCPENIPERQHLKIKEGRLYTEEGGQLNQYRQHDYCLIRIEQLAERNDYTVLPFYKAWEDVVDRIWGGDITGATGKFNEFAQQMAKSPELTPTHRHQLIELFRANFESEIKVSGHGAPENVSRSPATRGPAGVLGPVESLQRTAYLAEKAGLLNEKEAVKGLWEISKNWPRIPLMQARPQDFHWQNRKKRKSINNIINKQLKTLEQITLVTAPNPQALADAIMVASLSPD